MALLPPDNCRHDPAVQAVSVSKQVLTRAGLGAGGGCRVQLPRVFPEGGRLCHAAVQGDVSAVPG